MVIHRNLASHALGTTSNCRSTFCYMIVADHNRIGRIEGGPAARLLMPWIADSKPRCPGFRFSRGLSGTRLRRRGASRWLGSRPLGVGEALENVKPERGAEEGRSRDDDPACERDEPRLGVVRHWPLDPADE